MDNTIFVTGGAGFIGSALIRMLIKTTTYNVVNIDKLTYAGNIASLKEVENNSRYSFRQIDICDKNLIANLFTEFKPIGIIHLAAESHVDRSIIDSEDFIQTNIIGSYNLLECSRNYRESGCLSFKFVHVSTDEVFGSLGDEGYFDETTAYDPRSPYSASKASSDLLVKAWFHTYKLPIVITNCTNNYGPYHFPEKLIPLIINNALNLKTLPVYGSGNNIRDWLYVDDHAQGLILAFEKGIPGQSYCIGGHNEKTNLDVVKTICNILNEEKPIKDFNYESLITFVKDRAGHDYRYAMNPSKITNELNWAPQENFNSGIRKTVLWYLANQKWVQDIQNGSYTNWINLNYTNRI